MTSGTRPPQPARRKLLAILGLAAILGLWYWGHAKRATARRVRAALYGAHYGEAGELLRTWLQARPEDAEAHYLSALLAWRMNRLDEIPPALERARELGYVSDLIDRLWGLALHRAGRADEAEPLLRRAWENPRDGEPDPEIAEALAKLAMSRLELGFASEVLDRWARESPADPRPMLWRAEVDRRLGADRSVTISHFQQALKRDPTCDEARLGLGGLFYVSGRYSEAAECYATTASRSPANPDGHVGVGICAHALGDEAGAQTALDRALALDPGNTLALKTRAAVSLRRGQPDEALAFLTKATAADPFDPELRYQRSLVLSRLGRRAEADGELARSVQLRHEHGRMAEIQSKLVAAPKDIPLRIEAARWMMAHGRAEEGIVWAGLVLRDQPDNPEASRLLADYHDARGERGLANHYRLHAKEGSDAKSITPPSK
jgi:tetratricopeptide (TPR) repeat protein